MSSEQAGATGELRAASDGEVLLCARSLPAQNTRIHGIALCTGGPFRGRPVPGTALGSGLRAPGGGSPVHSRTQPRPATPTWCPRGPLGLSLLGGWEEASEAGRRPPSRPP